MGPFTLICDDFESLQNLKMHWVEILLETCPQNWGPIFDIRFQRKSIMRPALGLVIALEYLLKSYPLQWGSLIYKLVEAL